MTEPNYREIAIKDVIEGIGAPSRESVTDWCAEFARSNSVKYAVEQRARVLELEAQLAELKGIIAINHDEETQIYEEMGLPKCPLHGSYCTPHVDEYVKAGLEATAQLATIRQQARREAIIEALNEIVDESDPELQSTVDAIRSNIRALIDSSEAK